MKSNFLTAIVIALAIWPLSGHARGWNLGVEAGYVSNTLSVDEYKSTARNGFKFGLDAEYTFGNRVALESGVAYIRKGATTTGENMNSAAISAIKFAEMDYLQIPLMVGYKAEAGSGLSIKPEVGGYFAVGVGGDSFVTGRDNFNQPYEARVSTFSA